MCRVCLCGGLGRQVVVAGGGGGRGELVFLGFGVLAGGAFSVGCLFIVSCSAPFG